MSGRALLAAALLAAAPAARAVELFSPGELSRPHAALEGLANCTKCHPQGQQLSEQACLACHGELKASLAERRGLHGRLGPSERACWSCHHEHQGRDFAIVDFGPAGRKGFDHARTGVPLQGKHAGLACERCHDPSRIADPAVRRMLDREPHRKSFLGAPDACSGCHADEHRGQLGTDCRRCHGESGWKPAPGFDHARTAYPLLGKHRLVACDKCHPAVVDPAVHTGPLRPRSARYLRLAPIPHGSCQDCHRDPHQGRFGEACSRCHTEADWKSIVSASGEVRSFHDRTRYRLEGAHAAVACKACHGPFPGEKAVFRGLAFGACTDCHVDAHVGQMQLLGPGGARCDRCHVLQSFASIRFGPEEHRQTRYPLEGAHRTVACAACHRPDPRVAERFPAAARQELERRGRPVRISLVAFALAGDFSRCETCHADPHGGQFDRKAGGRGCASCHELSSFARTRFDHARDTRFPLEGRHATARCSACHPAQPGPRGSVVVRYAGVTTRCAGCHADPHGSQFAPSPRDPTDCGRCHTAQDWRRPLRFRHEPPFTEFRLTGRHLAARCEACHLEVTISPTVKIRRYLGLPRTCEGCHADFHRGAFRGFEP